MKYGDTLEQRSIAEWGAYNIDYNEIKHLIKVRTTRDQARAIDVPGKEREGSALKEFESELYAELYEQYQRIDLFVQSKSGEIKRKLDHLYKQVKQLDRRNLHGEQSRISIRRLEKYSKVEEAILKAGEEIQSLSRFVGAQRLAFQKLVKKYKKWTGSPTLGRRVERDIFGRTSSFSPQYFESLLAQWTNVLACVRAPFNPRVASPIVAWNDSGNAAIDRDTSELRESNDGVITGNSYAAPTRVPPSVAELHNAAENGSDVDLDTALATLPLGPLAGTAAYWVHPDNIIELQVLLLQHMRSRSKKSSSPNSNNVPGSGQARRTSVSSYGHTAVYGADDEVGHIVLDDLEPFAKKQSEMVISDRNLQSAAASVRYSTSDEAMIVVSSTLQKAKLKRKHLQYFFNPGMSRPRPRSRSIGSTGEHANGFSNPRPDRTQDLEDIRDWLARHPEVQPLVDMQYQRSRFVGVGNDPTHGLWATLDKEVRMRKACENQLGTFEYPRTPDESAGEPMEVVRFPYAVLEVRWEGENGVNLVQVLDRSHLTERVRGFSLETHAVAVLCKPKSMSPPSWLPALGKDIRKIPESTTLPRRQSSNLHSCSQSASTKPASTSATSTGNDPSSTGLSSTAVETVSTSVPNKPNPAPSITPRKKRREPPHRVSIAKSPQPASQRYWNEFDDGDEASDNEAYTILVNPETSHSLPGAAKLSKYAHHVISNINQSARSVGHWLSPQITTTDDEARPLKGGVPDLGSNAQPSQLDDDDSSTENIYRQRSYATFPNLPYSIAQAHRNRETLLFRLYVSAFAVSFITLFIAAMLAASARRKAALPADIGILVGIIAALTSSIAGVGLMYTREDELAWLHKSVVMMAFVLVCVISGVLLALVGSF